MNSFGIFTLASMKNGEVEGLGAFLGIDMDICLGSMLIPGFYGRGLIVHQPSGLDEKPSSWHYPSVSPGDMENAVI